MVVISTSIVITIDSTIKLTWWVIELVLASDRNLMFMVLMMYRWFAPYSVYTHSCHTSPERSAKITIVALS